MKTVNRGLSAFCSFLVGAGLGVTIAWHFAKIKYEKIADEEIESMKKVLLKDKEKDNDKKTSPLPSENYGSDLKTLSAVLTTKPAFDNFSN